MSGAPGTPALSADADPDARGRREDLFSLLRTAYREADSLPDCALPATLLKCVPSRHPPGRAPAVRERAPGAAADAPARAGRWTGACPTPRSRRGRRWRRWSRWRQRRRPPPLRSSQCRLSSTRTDGARMLPRFKLYRPNYAASVASACHASRLLRLRQRWPAPQLPSDRHPWVATAQPHVEHLLASRQAHGRVYVGQCAPTPALDWPETAGSQSGLAHSQAGQASTVVRTYHEPQPARSGRQTRDQGHSSTTCSGLPRPPAPAPAAGARTALREPLPTAHASMPQAHAR